MHSPDLVSDQEGGTWMHWAGVLRTPYQVEMSAVMQNG